MVNGKFNKCQKGAALVEYVILMSLISVLSITAVKTLGTKTTSVYVITTTSIASATPSGITPTPDWTDPDTHPDYENCLDVTPESPVTDQSYECYAVDPNVGGFYDFQAFSTNSFNAVISGPGTSGPFEITIIPGNGGSTTIYDAVDPANFDIMTGYGTDNVYLTGVSCSDLSFREADFGFIETTLPSGAVMGFSGDPDGIHKSLNIYCPGDNTLLTSAEISESMASDSPPELED